MLQSREFLNRVLRKPRFSHRVLSMVVDEAHCVSHWGANFRKKYASLGTVRSFLPRGTPVIAVTATLTARVRRDLYSKLHFPRTGQKIFSNFGNDRPNVSIVVRGMKHAQNTYADLDFALPSIINVASDIPKAYIYVDDIKAGGEIIDHLNKILHKRNPDVAAQVPIRPFNAMFPAEYREKAMEAFKDGSIRILVCTDAAGMVGADRDCVGGF